MSNNSSEKLLDRYAHDLDAAAIQLFERYASKIVSLANLRLPDHLRSKVDADDILQETMAALHDAIGNKRILWQSQGDLWNYIAGITKNKIASAIEKYATSKRDLDREKPLAFDPQATKNDHSLLALLNELCQNEKPLIRTIFNMHLEGHSQVQIAKSVDRSQRTVRRIIDAFRNKIIASDYLDEAVSQSIRKPGCTIAEYQDYQLLWMIGSGSFSKVYLALQKSTDQLFAFKAIRKRWLLNKTVRAAFINEAEKLQKIDDPNVVKTYGWGDLPNGGLFLILDHIDGPTIHQLLYKSSQNQRQDWLQQIECTISRLHDIGIAHRDLSTRNVLIDNNDQIKLIDFAFSKSIGTFQSDKNLDRQAIARIRGQLRVAC